MSPTPPDFENSIPAQLRERYTDFEYVGQGGMGRIVSATDTALDKRVAIKILPSTVVSDTAVTRFHQEAKAVSKLNHQNVVQVMDFGFAGSGEPYLVMEYVKGQTLDSFIEAQGKVPLRTAIRLAIQMCTAIEHAHTNGIIHRDLKPGNIMLDEKNNVKVLDFGLAKIVDNTNVDWRLTKPGSAIGSPLYMSPEQLRGEDIDERSDVYSLALVIYKMVTGAVPFEDSNLMKILTGRLSQAPPVLPQNYDNVLLAEALNRIIGDALETDRVDRTGSMSELRDELLALHEIEDPPDKPVEEDLEREEPPKPNVNRSKKPALIAVGFVILLVAWFARTSLFPAKVLVKPTEHDADYETKSLEKQEDEELPGFRLKASDGMWTAASRVEDKDLMVLKSPNLLIENLSLEGNKHITVEGMKTIVTLPIKQLMLRDARLGDEIIPYVNKMHLQNLDLRLTDVTSAGVHALAPSKELKELSLAELNVNNDCLPYVVKSFPNLIRIVLSQTKVNGEGLKLLKPLHLKYLEISSLKLTDKDMDTVVMLHPKSITMESNLITDKGVDKLMQLPVLTHLGVNFNDRVTPAKLEEVRKRYPDIDLDYLRLEKKRVEILDDLVEEPDKL